MFFRVENLGPLRVAEVDLSKDLILLTGPNNTGKTYVAWSVYGLLRLRGRTKVFQELADEILGSPKQTLDFDRVVTSWPRILEEAGDQLASRLHLCFAAKQEDFADVKVALRAGPGEPQRGMVSPILYVDTEEYTVSLHLNGREIVATSNVLFGEDRRRVVPFAQMPPATLEALRKPLGEQVGLLVMRTCWPYCMLLPVERVDVDMFAKELSIRRLELVDREIEAELDARPHTSLARSVGRYPWPIQDSLRMANDLTHYARSGSPFADLAVELEVVLGGAVELFKEGEVGFKPEGASSPLGIHLTSSMVKSLARLVFYFRHVARTEDLLMIDEPELNLHPDNQRKVARVLAKAVNRGLKLMMSTHSDYVLRELNNLILLNRDTVPVREVRERHGYTESELLSPGKIGVYLFKDGIAESVPVTEDGFEVRTIEEEINRMNAISHEIYVALHE